MLGYSAHGFRIDSELELAGLLLDASGEPDVRLIEGPPERVENVRPSGDLILESGEREGRWVTVSVDDDGWLITQPGFARFRLTADRRTLTGITDPSWNAEWLGVLSIGNPMALLIALEGDVPLHASAVVVRGRTLAFVGPSGRGKSTMAGVLMAQLDGQVVSDDLLRVTRGERCCYVGAVELRLRPGEISEHLAAGRDHRHTFDGRLAIRPPVPTTRRMPLDAIVLPLPDRSIRVPVVERVDPSTALFEILPHTRLTGWLTDDWQRWHFESVAGLVDDVPVLLARVPWGDLGPAAIDAVDDAIGVALDEAR